MLVRQLNYSMRSYQPYKWRLAMKSTDLLAGLNLTPEQMNSLGLDQKTTHTGRSKKPPAGFNPNSPKQVAHLVYDILGAPPPKDPKLSRRSTDKGVLADLGENYPIVKQIVVYRRVSKLKSSYLNKFESLADSSSRVHTELWIPGTETGRLSTIGGVPLLTIPRASDKEEGQFGRIIKDCIVAQEGYVLLQADSSQSELRIAADMSGDPFLIKGYNTTGFDLHSATATALFGPSHKKEERDACKDINFAFLYGGSEKSLSKAFMRRSHVGIDHSKATSLVKDYMRLMARLAAFRDEQFIKLKEQGYIETLTGRRRRFPLITELNEDEARKAATNMPIQGLSSEIILIAVNELTAILEPAARAAFPGGVQDGGMGVENCRILLTVHDSIVAEVKDEYWAITYYSKLIADRICDVASRFVKSVPWAVEIKVGKKWGSLEVLD